MGIFGENMTYTFTKRDFINLFIKEYEGLDSKVSLVHCIYDYNGNAEEYFYALDKAREIALDFDDWAELDLPGCCLNPHDFYHIFENGSITQKPVARIAWGKWVDGEFIKTHYMADF